MEQSNTRNDLYILRHEVPNVDRVSVCYYGTNETVVAMNSKLTAHFIVYYCNTTSEEYEYCTHMKMTQNVSSSGSVSNSHEELCMEVMLNNCTVGNNMLRFGVHIYNNCEPLQDNECPLKLNFFSNSSKLLHKKLMPVRFNHLNKMSKKKLQIKEDNARQENFRDENLNIRIAYEGKV